MKKKGPICANTLQFYFGTQITGNKIIYSLLSDSCCCLVFTLKAIRKVMNSYS